MPQYHENNKSVSAWVSMRDYAKLRHLAFIHKVTIASYIRSIIVDALQEEQHIPKPVISDPFQQSEIV